MSKEELDWLKSTAKQMKSVVEIGSWKGRSTQALLIGCRGPVVAVDNFHSGTEDMINECRNDAVYYEFMENVGHFKNLTVEKGDSDEIFKKYIDKQFEMVFLDGGHSYEDVSLDIKNWGSLATKVVCGHDYDIEDVAMAVDEFGGELIVGSIWAKFL